MSYSDFIASVADSRGGNYSRGSLVDLSMALFNEDGADINIYTKKGDTYVATTVNPGRNVRANLIAPICKQMGVDKAELPRINEMKCTRAGAESLSEYALVLLKEYISYKGMGRKLTLPMTSPGETVQTIGVVEVPKKVKDTTMISKDDDGHYYVSPTGKRVTTDSHYKAEVKNRVPVWLKTVEAAT